MKHPLHYFTLTIIISISVCIGNLASNYITAAYTTQKAKQAAEQLRQSISKQQAIAKERATIRANEIKQAEIEARKKSQRAKKLLIQCNEWKSQNAHRDSEISRTEMKRHCNAYRRYIDTGRP